MRSIRHFVKSTLPSNTHTDQSEMDSELMADAHHVNPKSAELDPDTLPSSPSMTDYSDLPSPSGSHDGAFDGTDKHGEDISNADSVAKAALSAGRKILEGATAASKATTSASTISSTPPQSPSRVLRRLPSMSIMRAVTFTSTDTLSPPPTASISRPSVMHKRSTSSLSVPTSLKVRPRSVSHPDLRDLMEQFDKARMTPAFEASYTDIAEESDTTPGSPVPRDSLGKHMDSGTGTHTKSNSLA